MTKTNTETEARDYVAINNFNVGGLYDKISPCTAAGLDDEELCKQVRYVKKGWGRVFRQRLQVVFRLKKKM